ncbi:hypothetical protein G6L37_01815 [Agrobacterium rubi]|nr:hypothetical protein [Agrobacterium rubi]NTF24130.1 hypothetical protein [Agrobacterium rubi]
MSAQMLNPSRSRYSDVATSREACESIIECNPHHIKFLPLRFVDSRLAALAIRLGASPEEIPAIPV